MKKLMVLSSVFLVFIFATACSNGNNIDLIEPGNSNDTTDVENGAANNDNDDTNSNNKVTDENNEDINMDNNSGMNDEQVEAKNQDDMKEMLKQLDFYEVELEVSYENDKEFEIEIDHHSNGEVEAKVEDELNNKNIKDDLEAFNYIFPNVKKLNVSKEIDKQDAINQVLEVFDLPDDYEEIDIEFEFEDGVKLSFEDKK